MFSRKIDMLLLLDLLLILIKDFLTFEFWSGQKNMSFAQKLNSIHLWFPPSKKLLYYSCRLSFVIWQIFTTLSRKMRGICLMKLPRKLLLEKILPQFWNYENPNSSFLTNKKLFYVVSYSKNNFWSISLIQTFSSCTNPKIVSRCVTLHTCINCRRIMSGVERTDPSARKFVLHS